MADDSNVTRFPLDASFQGVNRLFVLALTMIMMLTRLKKAVIGNTFFQEQISAVIMY